MAEGLQVQTPQESPRDADSKGLLPKMKSINWNQDLSGTAISQHETFDETDSSTDGSGRGLFHSPSAFMSPLPQRFLQQMMCAVLEAS